MNNHTKCFILALGLTALGAEAQSLTPPYAQQNHVEVPTTAIELPRLRGRVAIEIRNQGPNPIACGFSNAVTMANGAELVAETGVWRLDVKDYIRIWCIGTVLQVSGNSTIVSEVK